MDITVYLEEARATLRSQEDRFRDIEAKTGILVGAILALYGFSITAASSGAPALANIVPAIAATIAVAIVLIFAAGALRVRDFEGAPMKWLGSHLGEPPYPKILDLARRYRKLLTNNECSLQKKVKQLKRAQFATGAGVLAIVATLLSVFLTPSEEAGAAAAFVAAEEVSAASPLVGECHRLLLQGGFPLVP